MGARKQAQPVFQLPRRRFSSCTSGYTTVPLQPATPLLSSAPPLGTEGSVQSLRAAPQASLSGRRSLARHQTSVCPFYKRALTRTGSRISQPSALCPPPLSLRLVKRDELLLHSLTSHTSLPPRLLVTRCGHGRTLARAGKPVPFKHLFPNSDPVASASSRGARHSHLPAPLPLVSVAKTLIRTAVLHSWCPGTALHTVILP